MPSDSSTQYVLTIKNCNPAGTTITNLLLSLIKANSTQPLILKDNVTHIILYAQKWRFNDNLKNEGNAN